MTSGSFALTTREPAPATSPVLPLIVETPGANALVPVANPNGTTIRIRQELEQAIALSDVMRARHTAITYGLPQFQPSRTQKIASIFSSGYMVAAGVVTLFGSFIAGAVAAGTTGSHGFGFAEQFKSLACVMGTYGVLPIAAALAVETTAHKLGVRQGQRRITAQDVAPTISAFEDSEGNARALRGAFLARWHDDLHTAKVLSPEARELLKTATTKNDGLEPALRERATLWRDLATQVKHGGEIDGASIVLAHQVIERFPPEQRHDIATAVRDALRASGRKATYEGDHALHELPERYLASEEGVRARH